MNRTNNKKSWYSVSLKNKNFFTPLRTTTLLAFPFTPYIPNKDLIIFFIGEQFLFDTSFPSSNVQFVNHYIIPVD